MRKFIQHDCPNYRLTMYGGGVAYQLDSKQSKAAYFCQGDGALQFEADLASVETNRPTWLTGEVLAYLWDQCGYGDAAYDLAA